MTFDRLPPRSVSMPLRGMTRDLKDITNSDNWIQDQKAEVLLLHLHEVKSSFVQEEYIEDVKKKMGGANFESHPH